MSVAVVDREPLEEAELRESQALRERAPAPSRERGIEAATVHALFWLLVASGAGLLMASLLVAPDLGRALGPLGYGRWAAVHLDLALYGWLALPLVALLLRAYGVAGSRAGAFAVHAWSASLVAGAVSWLAGDTSGKIFLDWEGPARLFFLGAMVVLAGVLLYGLVRGATIRTWKLVLWIALAGVPAAMFVATDPGVYPHVNPASGGPTGASLLLSTLGLVAILVAAPALSGLHRREDRRATAIVGALLAAHAAAGLAIGPGDATHRDPAQIAAVVSVVPWAWIVPRYLARFRWPEGARPWRTACLAWGFALVATGVGAFFPGILDRVKFTNALVGHAHAAMAGLATSFGALALATLNAHGRLHAVLSDRRAFVLWNAGCAVHVAALMAVGALEAADPGVLFRPSAAVSAGYVVRAAAGVAMAAAAGIWLRRSLGEVGA